MVIYSSVPSRLTDIEYWDKASHFPISARTFFLDLKQVRTICHQIIIGYNTFYKVPSSLEGKENIVKGILGKECRVNFHSKPSKNMVELSNQIIFTKGIFPRTCLLHIQAAIRVSLNLLGEMLKKEQTTMVQGYQLVSEILHKTFFFKIYYSLLPTCFH